MRKQREKVIQSFDELQSLRDAIASKDPDIMNTQELEAMLLRVKKMVDGYNKLSDKKMVAVYNKSRTIIHKITFDRTMGFYVSYKGKKPFVKMKKLVPMEQFFKLFKPTNTKQS